MEKQMNIPQLRFPEFKEEWAKKMLGDICEKIQDGNYGGDYPKASEFLKDGIPFLTSKAIGQDGNIHEEKIDFISIEKHKQLKKAHLKLNDVLFTNRGSNVGSIGIVTERFANGNIGPQITLLRCNCEMDYLFLKEIMSSDIIQKQVNSQNSGSAMNFFGIGETSKFKLPITSITEQIKIAKFLTSIFEKIQALKKKKSLLEQYKKGVMQKLFSQALRFKDENGNDFPDWEEKKLGEICEIIGGGTPETSRDEYWNGNIQWFTPTEIKSDYVSKSSRTISELGLQKSSAKKLPIGTILLTTRATIGEASITLEECTTNQGFQSLVTKKGNNNIYIFNWIKENKQELSSRANGSTFPEISKSEIEKIEIPTPSFEEQTLIANFLSSIDEKINHIQTEIAKTEQWKKGLLQRMFV